MSSAPPPGAPDGALVLELAAPGGAKRRFGRRGDTGAHRLTLTPQEIAVEHTRALRAPLRFAPGAVTVAAIDPGPGDAGSTARGRFPVLRRLAEDRVVPREAGIEGWLWTSSEGSACTALGDDAPNLAFVFSPPLSDDRVEAAFGPAELAELARRSPLGQPALFGLLLRVQDPSAAGQALGRYGMLREMTDREVPPAQRRHLPGDTPAGPGVGASRLTRARGSIPPPGAA